MLSDLFYQQGLNCVDVEWLMLSTRIELCGCWVTYVINKDWSAWMLSDLCYQQGLNCVDVE